MTSRTETDRTNGANVYSTTFGYDSRGNLVWQVNAEGNPTRFTFDGLSRLTKKEVALGYGSPITTFTSSIDTQWGFDKNNRLVSFKDDAANESTWAYDAKDRQTAMTYPNSTSIAYVYDANDNATQVTDAAGNVISDTFDALSRNTARSVSLVAGFQDTTSETRTLDALTPAGMRPVCANSRTTTRTMPSPGSPGWEDAGRASPGRSGPSLAPMRACSGRGRLGR